MPYRIGKNSKGKHCVYNAETNESKGCSDTMEQAKAHMRALYAAEKKELDDKGLDELVEKSVEDSEKCGSYYEADYRYVPYGTTTFSDLDVYRQNQEMAKEARDLTKDFQGLVDNVMSSSEITDKPAAIKALAEEFAARVENPDMDDKSKPEPETLAARIVNTVKEAFGLKPKSTHPATPDFMIWKESDGSYHWVARYSNNIRDDDNPPEIIAAKSHQLFTERVEKGVYPSPELWLWHEEDWRWGKSNWVAYDDHGDTGFAVAGGVVDKGFEPLAELIMSLPPEQVGVSHGMPRTSIVRDSNDKSIIVEHQTREISPLPMVWAANKFTGFSIVKEEQMIPDEKKQVLRNSWNLSDELLTMLEQKNAEDATRVKETGLETKDEPEVEDTAVEETTLTDGTPAEEVPAEEVPEDAPEPEETPAGETSPEETSPTPPETKDAPTLETVVALLTQLTQSFQAVDERVKSLEDLAKSDTERRDEEKNANVPPASLGAAMATSIIGNEKARIDGRSSLAKSGPKQTPDPSKTVTGVGFLDSIITGNGAN